MLTDANFQCSCRGRTIQTSHESKEGEQSRVSATGFESKQRALKLFLLMMMITFRFNQRLWPEEGIGSGGKCDKAESGNCHGVSRISLHPRPASTATANEDRHRQLSIQDGPRIHSLMCRNAVG